MPLPADSLNLFHPLIRKWFLENVGTPTDIQGQSWPEIAGGKHVLVTAPTGSGKTLTAFLWAINSFLAGRKSPDQQRVLYISPLKALNNDIQRNLNAPLSALSDYFAAAGEPFPEIRTAVRSGDTEPSERRKMMRQPPEILITTPESLNVLLTSQSGRRMLTGISTVILDEIHAVAATRRGTYLITAIERLIPINGEVQRIALSATVKPLKTVAEFVGGFRINQSGSEYHYEKRPVSIIRSRIEKQYRISVEFPEGAKEPSNTDVWWPALTQAFRNVIHRNRSTLFFANSRRMVEKITRFVNETEGNRIYSHHGALSKEIRSVVEKRFKEGELAAIIATSSLELGIDIGSVDEVVLIQAPTSIASTIQRIGRSGHGVGQISRGTFYPIHSRDFLAAAVLSANINGNDIETIKPLDAPLDVLAQVLLSTITAEPRDIDQLFGEIRASYPYHKLTRKEYDLVIQMMAGRYADARIRELKPRILLDRVKNTAQARDKGGRLLYLSGGVIPDRGYFNLRVAESKAKIGELDEEFVWERSLGDAFPLGNQVWRIHRITHNDVEVSPVEKTNSLIPFWRAEDLNRSVHLSQKIGDLLEEADRGPDRKEFKQQLMKQYYMTQDAAHELSVYLKRQQKETRAPLPHRHHVLVEHFRDPVNVSESKQTILHTIWGGRVNRPFAFALSAAWEERYNETLETFANNDSIMMKLPPSTGFSEILDLVNPGKIHQLLRKGLESTGYFGARFRENAQRALLLPRRNFQTRMPLWLNRLRSQKLLQSVSKYDDFPILLETWRGCLNNEFEIEALQNVLEDIHTGEIKVSEVVTKKPSPFADGIIWTQTNDYMYRDDSSRSKLRTNLSDSLLKDVMHSSRLRPRFSPQLLESFHAKLHRTAPGYPPDTPEELLQWVRERQYIPSFEWDQLLDAVQRDHDLEPSELLNPIENRLHRVKKDGKVIAVIALENLPAIAHGLNIVDKAVKQAGERLSQTEIFSEDADETLVRFLGQWLQFYGPVPHEFLTDVFPLDPQRLASALEALSDDDRIIVDEFREEREGLEEICDIENLEILLRMRRSQSRPAVEPKTIDAIPLFLAAFQGVTAPGENLEDLQQCMENLFGYPARAGLWETDILPARLSPYYNSWMDAALRDNELIWFGCGNERIGFSFFSDFELFAAPRDSLDEKDQSNHSNPSQSEMNDSQSEGENEDMQNLATEELRKMFAENRGKFDLGDLIQDFSFPSADIAASLWELAWQGRVTNDHFKTVRNGVMNRFKAQQPAPAKTNRHGRGRFGVNRWQGGRSFAGNWYALPEIQSDDSDQLDRQDLVKDRIRQLFNRYGILFRELLWNELPELRWANVFRVLRLMELSGEIVSGQFFKGIPGLQFCTPEALSLFTGGLPEDAIYWLNAADPASPCGIGLEQLKPLFPHRLPSTHIVLHGRKVVIVSKKNGKELTISVDPDHPRLQEYLEFFKVLIGREFQPVKYISVETINEAPVIDSPYKEPMREFGFKKDYKAMTLMKRY